jgi:hypothetical protein
MNINGLPIYRDFTVTSHISYFNFEMKLVAKKIVGHQLISSTTQSCAIKSSVRMRHYELFSDSSKSNLYETNSLIIDLPPNK